MDHYTLLNPLIGGILIGLASLLATVLSGKIPGISGVFGRLLVPATPDPPSQRYGATGKTWPARSPFSTPPRWGLNRMPVIGHCRKRGLFCLSSDRVDPFVAF
jgi:uncharacterized membrane protein YedE/YeeE